MNLTAIILALITFLSTLIGGFIVLKFKKSLSIIFAFAAGSILTVALMEILPESLDIANNFGIPVKDIMMSVVLSFLFFIILEKYFSAHPIHGIISEVHVMGPLGAGSLILLSFLDGLTMGIAFQVRLSIGILVGLSIIIHDLPDGINTVVLMLKSEQSEKKALLFLFMDGLAPLLGVLLTSLIRNSEKCSRNTVGGFCRRVHFCGSCESSPGEPRAQRPTNCGGSDFRLPLYLRDYDVPVEEAV